MSVFKLARARILVYRHCPGCDFPQSPMGISYR